MRGVRSSLFVFALGSLAMGLAAPASSVSPPANLGVLASVSDAVVMGRAQGSLAFERGSWIVSRTGFAVEEVLSGPLERGECILVETPGGRVGEKAWVVAGSPSFAPGERYLLFLHRKTPEIWQLQMLAYGLLHEAYGDGGVSLLEPVPEAGAIGLRPVRSQPVDPVGTYATRPLLRLLSDVLEGSARWDDAGVRIPDRPGMAESTYAAPAPCRFLGQARWAIWDLDREEELEALHVFADEVGDMSFPGGGFTEVEDAVKAWNAVPGVCWNLQYTEENPPSFLKCTDNPGVDRPTFDVVAFNDICDDLPDLVNCAGTLACGGYRWHGTHEFDGADWRTITGLWVVLNNDLGACLDSSRYQHLVGHELGHGLGFGHHEDPMAQMWGMDPPALNGTDRACARYLYPCPGPPFTAEAYVTPYIGVAPHSVQFTSMINGGTAPFLFQWNFGDGSAPDPAANPAHVYQAAGTYNVALQVFDATLKAAAASTSVVVADPCPVRAQAEVQPPSGTVPLSVTFYGWAEGGCGDPGEYAYDWDFPENNSYLTGRVMTLSFEEPGSFPWTLRVTDASGHIAYQSGTVNATTVGPYARAANYPLRGDAPLSVEFTGTVTGGTPPYQYDWDFGDGSAHAATLSAIHTYTQGGEFRYRFKATDSAQLSHEWEGYVAVTGPLAGSVTAAPASGDAPLDVSFTATASGGTPPYSYTWDFGDGSPAGSGAEVTHTYTTPGTFTATVTVTDSHSGTAEASASIQVLTPVTPPGITSATKKGNPFRLKIGGTNFHSNCTVRIDGVPAPQTKWKSATLAVAKGGSALKAMVPKGVPVQITVVNNDDGGVSAPFSYTR